MQPDGIDEMTRDDIPSIEDMCKIVSMPVYEPSDVADEESMRRVACHEMGHAVCRLALTGATDIIVVTIEQEGNGALGYVQHKAAASRQRCIQGKRKERHLHARLLERRCQPASRLARASLPALRRKVLRVRYVMFAIR